MDYIPYGKQYIDDEDIQAVVDVLKSDWITQGPKIAEFEKALAKKAGARFGVAFANGTVALHAACLVAGIQEGDEVITSPMTFVASANCAHYLGAEVRFADIQADTYCIDPDKIKEAITTKTKVLIPVDFAGQPCDMEEINAIAKENNLIVIEDAAHSLGATYKDKPVGALADMTMFSFHPVKAMTTGEGGMIVTDNEEYVAHLRKMRSHGIEQNIEGEGAWYYEVQELGYNYRITDMQCALGLSQLKKLDGFIEKRGLIAAKYTEAFAGCDQVIVPSIKEDRQSAWHLYMLRLNADIIGKTRRQIFDELRALNIGVHVHYIPVHLQPYFREKYGHQQGDFPVTENYYDYALTIPLYPGLSDQDIQFVVDNIYKVVKDKDLIKT